MTLVVHLIDFHERNPWIEGQIDYFLEAGINQGLVSISAGGNIHDSLKARGLENVAHFDRGIWVFLKACVTLRKWNRSQTTIIYAHGHIPAFYASLFRTFLGIGYVVCHHHPSPDIFIALRRRIFLRAIVHSIITKYYYSRALLIQVLSLEIEEVLLGRGISRNKILNIPLGLEFEKFYSKNIGKSIVPPNDEILLISISRLAWEKRIDLGIRTVAHLVKQGFPVKYLIVGSGPELGVLQSLASELGISESVDFLGYRDDINTILNEADILFHLSITEAYGQVLMEARLTELPIFSSACGVALDMESMNDPTVKIFRTEDSLQIATELKEFALNVPSKNIIKNGEKLYEGHDYKCVVAQIVKMFEPLTRI